jgi:hypothetical protein
LTRAGAWGSVGPEWTLSFLATYFAGLWAVRPEPANRAAVRLLVFGCLALISWPRPGDHPSAGGSRRNGFVLDNAVVQMISFGFVVL